MKRAMAFARRNARELVRVPLPVGFSLGFPLVLLALLTIIQRNIPVSMFEFDRIETCVAAFGLTFAALFSSTLIARDRASSLMLRLGEKLYFCYGSEKNIKVTTVDDLELFKALLKMEREDWIK